MAITGHTGIPPFLNVFATPSVSIAATTEAPYCSGADVTFNATIVAPALQYLNNYYFTINGITASGKVLTMTTNSLVDSDVVRFVMVHKNGSVYYSNSIVAAVQSCTTPIGYGLLYNNYCLDDIRLLSSSNDWVVPTKADFDELVDIAGDEYTAGEKLKLEGTTNWEYPNYATNDYNFNAIGGGLRFMDTYGYEGWFSLGTLGKLWTTTITGNGITYYYLNLSNQFIWATMADDERAFGFSVRFSRNATAEELLLADGTTCDDYIGNDLKSYGTVKIGTKVWMSKNLAETKFRNGDWLTGFDGGVYTPIDTTTWTAATTEMCCAYNDDINLI